MSHTPRALLHASDQLLKALRQLDTAAEPVSAPTDRPTLIEATSDAEALRAYLAVRCAKTTTRQTVLRDLRKFLVFLALEGLERLAEVKVHHCQAFQQWLVAPDPTLCSGTTGRPPAFTRADGRLNPDWKPFRAPLSRVSANQTVNKIQALYQWLSDVHYLTGNPWAHIKPLTKAVTKGREEQEEGAERELPIECIQAVLHYLDHGTDFEGVSARRHAQWRWFFYFHLYTAARIRSGCTATLDDLYIDRKGYERLTLTVKGAGVRRKDVPWIPEMEEEYHRYRAALGLPPIRPAKPHRRRQPEAPLPLDQGPRYLLLPLTVTPDTLYTEALSYQSVHSHLVALFRTSRRWAIEHPDLALADWQLAILADATGHWIRHGTAKLLGQHAREQLGHASQQQTDAYQAAEAQKHVARLRRLADGEVDDEPLYELLAAPIEDRVRWIKILIESTEAEYPSLRQELLDPLTG